jgi:hypothetical protein
VTVTLADLGGLVKRKFPGFEGIPDDELGRLVKARCSRLRSGAQAGPAGEGQSEPSARGGPTEQTTGPALPPDDEALARQGKTPEKLTDEDGVASGATEPAGLVLAAIDRAATRLSGAARRDPDLRRLPLAVDIVVHSGHDYAVSRVFQRTRS